jgi:mRNA-degrading endonuclease RelE of RelBE toxin-antitoxin system
MPNYRIEISETAANQLNKLPHNISGELIEIIQSLAENPRPHGCKNLKAEKAIEFAKETTALFMTYMIRYF